MEFKSTILKKLIPTSGFFLSTHDNFFRIPFLLSKDANNFTDYSQATFTRFYLGLFSATTFHPSYASYILSKAM